jgi:beta-lactamase regulating signal transducer with metallopeptidase domain
MSLISNLTMRTKTVNMYQPADGITLSLSNTLRAAVSYHPIRYKVNILNSVFEVAAWIWILVGSAILILLSVTYISTLLRVRHAKHLKESIYLSDTVPGPAVYGIFRPRIVLPTDHIGEDLEYVLRHEKTHIRRGDNLWRILALLAVTVHWFNPLAWVFLRAFLTDLELACDEDAVRGYDDSKRREYARTLLQNTQRRSVFASAFGGAKIRTRIENVLSYKKMTFVSASGFTILVMTIIYTLITNAG